MILGTEHAAAVYIEKILSVYRGRDFAGGLGFVHGVDMNVVHSVFLKVADLADGVVDAGLPHVVFIVSVGGDQVRVMVVPSCLAEVMGMIPAQMGISMPFFWAFSRKE